MGATLRQPRPAFTSLDLPRPGRSALAFALLVAAALALDAAPRLPWTAGVVAAALFAVAGTARTLRDRHELAAVRRSADRLIVQTPTSRDASELVRWRSSELVARASRDALRREVDRLLRAVDPRLLPSASPLCRTAVRANEALLRALAARLGDEHAVSARGILLARAFLRDPASPLYSEVSSDELGRAARRVLGALEP